MPLLRSSPIARLTPNTLTAGLRELRETCGRVLWIGQETGHNGDSPQRERISALQGTPPAPPLRRGGIALAAREQMECGVWVIVCPLGSTTYPFPPRRRFREIVRPI